MKQTLPLLFGSVLVLYILGSSYCFSKSACCSANITATTSKANSAVEAAAPAAILTNTTGLSLADAENDFQLNANENLYFEPSSFNYLPLSDPLVAFHEELANYLIANPDRTALITGRYQADETNNSILSSLGLARANQIKTLLLDLHVPESQLLIQEDLVNAISQTDDVFDNAIVIEMEETIVEEAASVESLEERLRNNPIALYFDKNAKRIELTIEQRQYFTDLVNYLSKAPAGMVLITGHADNEGDYNINRYFGRKRSEFVRNYLIANGIPMDRIKTVTKGAEQPIASNDTAEGRALNRRVEITLK